MTKIKNEAKFYKELAKHQIDKYSSEELKFDANLYQKIIHSDSRYAPQAHMTTLNQYIDQVKLHRQFNLEKSTRAHIDAPSGTWYTHRSPLGCFICEDAQLISVLTSMLEYIAKTYPNIPLRHTN